MFDRSIQAATPAPVLPSMPQRHRHRRLRQLGSPLVRLEDDFVPHPLTCCGVEVEWEPAVLADVYNRIRQLIRAQRLDLDDIGFGASGLIVTFTSRQHAALFKLFWIDTKFG